MPGTPADRPVRVAFVALPALGHHVPTLPVVAELRRRGHEVDYLSTTAYRDRCEAAGARFVDYGLVGEAPSPAAVGARPFALARFLLDLVGDFLPVTLGHLGIAADRLGIARLASVTTFALHRDLVERGRESSGGPVQTLRDLAALTRARRRLRAQTGVAVSVPDLLGTAGPGVVYTARGIQPRPELFGADLRFVGLDPGPATEDVSALLPEGDGPLVYASLGTLAGDGTDVFSAAVEALEPPTRLLLSTGSPRGVAALGLLRPGVRAEPTVPQPAVLARADVFLTHGGLNSAQEAALAGVPAVYAPRQMEQRLVARRFAELGAGAVVPVQPTVDELRTALTMVRCDPRYAAAARAVGAELRAAGGASAAADEILARATR